MHTENQGNFYYKIYGLHLCANHPLPEMQPAPAPRLETNLVRLFMVGHSSNLPVKAQSNRSPFYVSPYQDDNFTPVLQVWRYQKYYHLVYSYGNQFLISRSGDTVWCSWPDQSDFSLVIAYLLGPVLGFVLQLRKVLVLHASVVAVNGQALAILGASGAGKSTLAAELCLQGCKVLSDDIAALSLVPDQHVIVQPGYPRLRLWPESAEALFGPEHNLRFMVPGIIYNGINSQRIDKRYLELDGDNLLFHSIPQRLRAIYSLAAQTPSGEKQIISLHGGLAVVTLDNQSYMPYLLDRHGHERQLAALARLIKYVHIRKLYSTNNLTALPQLAQTILEDFDSLM